MHSVELMIEALQNVIADHEITKYKMYYWHLRNPLSYGDLRIRVEMQFMSADKTIIYERLSGKTLYKFNNMSAHAVAVKLIEKFSRLLK